MERCLDHIKMVCDGSQDMSNDLIYFCEQSVNIVKHKMADGHFLSDIFIFLFHIYWIIYKSLNIFGGLGGGGGGDWWDFSNTLIFLHI